MLLMSWSNFFLRIAQKLHDKAGKVVNLPPSERIPYGDHEINWAMMRTQDRGTNLFTMYGFIGEPGTDAWKYQLAVLPGEVVWADNINMLRVKAVQNAQMRAEQLKLTKTAEKIQ